VRTFTAFLGRSPDTATAEDLRRFQLHQTQTGVRAPSINGSVAALRFFFTVTLDHPRWHDISPSCASRTKSQWS
jgi:site-specific recombinase XerD